MVNITSAGMSPAVLVSRRLRDLFYMVTPAESSYATPEEVPDIVQLAIPAFTFFVFLENVISVAKGRGIAFRINDAFSSASQGVFSRLPKLLGRSVYFVTYVWFWNNFRVVELPWDSPITWWLAMIGVDFGYYWAHRAGHEVNLFWSGHQVHHSSEDYNLSTALRQSVKQVYFSWFFYLPLALCIPPSIFIMHQYFNLLFQFWIHTELIDRLGPLEWVLNTPSHHRVHHGRNPYCIDKNYAGTLIIWDRMFGTFAEERRDETLAYGLVHPIQTFEPISIQICHLQWIWGQVKKRRGLVNKLKTLFYGPGWEPGKPRMGEFSDLPQVKFPVQRYDSAVSWWCSLYVILHFLMTLTIQDTLAHAAKQGLPLVYTLGGIAIILLSLTAFGLIFDRSRYAPLLEVGRCVVLTGLMLWLPGARLDALSGAVKTSSVLAGIFGASALLWLAVVAGIVTWPGPAYKSRHSVRRLAEEKIK